MKIFEKSIPLEKALPWILIVCGTIGLICALVIMYDKVELLKDPNFNPGCNLNPVISCGSIMESKQANAFGFPNPFIGMVGFTVVVTTGTAIFAGASKLRRWYWLGLQVGAVFGVMFVHWLFFQSVWRINALCPYCMGVWAMTIMIFWYVTLYNIQTGVIRLTGTARTVGVWARRHHLDILIFWLLAIAALILHHFWYYYGKYFQL